MADVVPNAPALKAIKRFAELAEGSPVETRGDWRWVIWRCTRRVSLANKTSTTRRILSTHA